MAESGDLRKPTTSTDPAAGGATIGTPANVAGAMPTQPAGAAANVAGATAAGTAENGLAFRSAEIGTKTARKEDVFAEHKRKDAEKKAKNKKTRKWILIFGGIGLVLVIGIVAIVVINMNKPRDWTEQWGEASESESQIDDEEKRKRIEEGRAKLQELLAKINTEREKNGLQVDEDGDLEIGEDENDTEKLQTQDRKIIDEILSEALLTATTPAEMAVIVVQQMQNAINGGDYQKTIELGQQIKSCSDPRIDLETRWQCHTLMDNAYWELGRENDSNKQNQEMQDVMSELIQLGVITGGTADNAGDASFIEEDGDTTEED